MSENTIVAAGGMSEHERRKKAKQQPRDGRGRWVREGAFVRWRADGQDWAGQVDKIENGIATVTAKQKDGSTTTRTLKTSSLTVSASKARLSSYAKRFKDTKNSTDRFLGENRPAIEEAVENGGALIEREDGYSVEVGKGQPIDGDGDGVVNEAENPEDETGTKEEEDKKQGNPLAFQLYAKPAAGGQSIGIYGDGVSLDEVIQDHKDSTAPEGDGEGGSEGGEAPAATVASASPKAYSVPKSVRESISLALQSPEKFTGEGLEYARNLCNDEQVGIEEVQWVYDFFAPIDEVENFYGGYQGRKWADKIMENEEYDPIQHDFDLSNLEYYAVSGDYELYKFDGLVGVDYSENAVFAWDGTSFSGPISTADDYEADMLEPIDPETAREIAYMIHDNKNVSFSTMDIFPEERNLFAMAASALDWDLYKDLGKFAYESQDRSVDASSQARDGGGKFGKPNFGLAQVSGTPEENTGEAVAEASSNAEAEQQESGSEDPMSGAQYFAIVDEVDQTSVKDIVVISSSNGQPAVFRRTMGQWTLDPDKLAELSGATPPAVVNLTDEEEIKDVLSQVDAYDSGKEPEGEFSAKEYSVFGPYGEVITAAGVPGVADTPSDWAAVKRLKDYWKYGAGAAKIRWGTKGDLTRAAKHLAKYVSDPWGLAQALHIELFGVSNYERDN